MERTGAMQTFFTNKFTAMLVFSPFLVSVSCTANKTHPIHITLPQEKVQGLKIGDTVKITTYGGERYKFRVEHITNESIEGEGTKIALVDIESIKKVYITGRTVAIVVGIIIVVAGLIFLGSKSDTSYKRQDTSTAQ